MCQSSKTSVVAWLVAVVIAMIMLSTGKKTARWNAFFILTFITIQLLEFFVWWFRESDGLTKSANEAMKAGCGNDKNKPSGDFFVRLIFIALWIQPLVQTFMASRYGNPKYKQQLMIITMAYFVMLIWAITKALDKNATFTAQPSTCEKDSSGHLVWWRSNDKGFIGPNAAAFLYLFGLFFGLFFMQPKLFGIILIVVGGLSATYASKHYKNGEASSMWCLLAILYAIVALMMAKSRKLRE